MLFFFISSPYNSKFVIFPNAITPILIPYQIISCNFFIANLTQSSSHAEILPITPERPGQRPLPEAFPYVIPFYIIFCSHVPDKIEI